MHNIPKQQSWLLTNDSQNNMALDMYVHYTCDINYVHHVALCFVLLRCISLRCISLCCISIRCVSLRCVSLRCISIRCVSLCCVSLRCVSLRSVSLSSVYFYSVTLSFFYLCFVTLCYTVSHCSGYVTLCSIALGCATLHCSKSVLKGRRCYDIKEANLIRVAKILRSSVVFQQLQYLHTWK